jgi:rhodanese-related sulfurtransferase
MSSETTDILGNQKKYNYALRAGITRDEFIKEVTHGLLPPPAYFPENVKMNKEGYKNFNTVLSQGLRALSAGEFEETANATDALILDTRKPESFAKSFIPGAINIGIDGSFAPWVGALITDMQQPILLVTDEGREQEVVTRLARVGYDNAIGYLQGGIQAWKAAGKQTDDIPTIKADELAAISNAKILDVRKENEFNSEHVIGAENIPLDYINAAMDKMNKTETYYVNCAGGYRSMIFNSILKARGYNNLVDVTGGFTALKESGKFELSAYVCPSSEL